MKIPPMTMRMSSLVILLFSGFWLFGCTTRYVSMDRSSDLTAAFETGRLPADYHYFYIGWENRPHMIVGLEPGYTPASRYWKPVEEADASLAELADRIYVSPQYDPYGAYIRDAKGERIGIWYSSARFASARVDPETRQVTIFTDEPWIKDGNGDSNRIGAGAIHHFEENTVRGAWEFGLDARANDFQETPLR